MNLRIRNGKHCSRQITPEMTTKYCDKDGNILFADNMPMEAFYHFHSQVMRELLRTTEGYVFYNFQILTGNKSAMYRLMGEFAENIKEHLMWIKGNPLGQPAQCNQVFNSAFEHILILHKDPKNAISRQFKDSLLERGKHSNIWEFKKEKPLSNKHKATFPTALVAFILDYFPIKGDKPVLDPFAGSGTSAYVCKQKNIPYTAIELSEVYCQDIRDLLASVHQ